MNRIFIVESRSETDSTDCAGSSDNDTDYVPFNENDTIAVDEDISHEYFNNQKRYVARCYQKNRKKLVKSCCVEKSGSR